MTSATELLPCPFCGGKAHIAECVGYRGDVSYTVNCDAIHDCIASDSGFWYSSREAAIEAWNTRATLGSGTCEELGSIRTWQSCNVWEHELSCGHKVDTLDREPPKHCPECGKAVES